jgi:ribosome-binding factor A
MPKSFSRTTRVAEVSQRIIARAIREEFKDPRVGLITISSVVISPDLRHAKVYVTILPEEKIEETLKILNAASGFFRSKLAEQLSLRVVPKPHFVYDDSVIRGNRIVALLDADLKDREVKNEPKT